MTRNQHRNIFNTILKKQEERSVANVYMALRKQYIRTINNVRSGGVQYAMNQLHFDLFNKEMGDAVRKIFIQVGVFMANRTLSQLKNIKRMGSAEKGADMSSSPSSQLQLKYATFGFNEEWINQILNYFDRYLLEKAVVSVSATTRDKLFNILSKALTEGWSNDQTVKELSDLVEIRNRARMIVRTETVRAANFGVLQGADKYDYETEKEWIAVEDNRTRHSHRNVDGERRDTAGTFSNGLQFPGDPNGPASETINCRCSLAMVAKRDRNGRLIPKRNVLAA